jgi:hypothetical protein
VLVVVCFTLFFVILRWGEVLRVGGEEERERERDGRGGE